MFGKKKAKNPGRFVYRSIGKFSRPLSFVLKGLFYGLLVATVVALICIPIVALMQISPTEMNFPPFLQSETGSGGNTVFHVSLCNGVQMTVAEERVTESAIKGALYAQLLLFALCCCVLAPICRFVSILLRNLADKRFGDKKNPDMICFSALTLLVGSPLISAASGYFTYILQKNFSGPGVLIKYAFQLDWAAVLMGVLLLIAGFAYGYENAQRSVSSLPAERNSEEN